MSACSHPTKISAAKIEIVGVWHEENPSDTTINELIFRDDGTFSVTIIPFEVYKDYWGTYTIDPKKHEIHLTITGGNNTPKDAKVARFHYRGDSKNRLILSDGYFGTFTIAGKTNSVKYRYIFVRGY
jgi:hypothetical protein